MRSSLRGKWPRETGEDSADDTRGPGLRDVDLQIHVRVQKSQCFFVDFFADTQKSRVQAP